MDVWSRVIICLCFLCHVIRTLIVDAVGLIFLQQSTAKQDLLSEKDDLS